MQNKQRLHIRIYRIEALEGAKSYNAGLIQYVAFHSDNTIKNLHGICAYLKKFTFTTHLQFVKWCKKNNWKIINVENQFWVKKLTEEELWWGIKNAD